MATRLLVQIIHPPQKFEFCNGWRYWIKSYGVEVTFIDMASLLNLIKMYWSIQKFIGGQGDRKVIS
jgi:hypothetical protein